MTKNILMVAVSSALVISTGTAVAATSRTGAEVVKNVCSKCHAEGEKGAPKIGELADWGPRMSKGILSLTDHAIRGYRGMPAHGGDAALTDLEITRAIIYMIVPKSSAHADMDKSMVQQHISGKKLYSMRCNVCHAKGKEGAPRVDDYKEWGARMSKGIDGLTESAVNGHNKMPSRGGLTNVSDSEVKSAIGYMIHQASSSYAKHQVVPSK